MQPVENELFYFGVTLEKFALHKAARVVGIFQHDGKKCFRLQYGDGELAHAELVDESHGAYELLSYDQAVKKHGEEAFK